MTEDDASEIERLRRERVDMSRERDEALERGDELVFQLDDAHRTIEELRAVYRELKSDVTFLEQERDEAHAAMARIEARVGEDHRRTIAQMVEEHERELGRVATERDGAVVEAERAAQEAKRAFARADRATDELLTERRRLDRKLRLSSDELERLGEERDAALGQVDDLAAMHAAAEAEILRVGEEFMAIEEQKKRHQSKLVDLQDKFIDDLMRGHEEDLVALATQRDEARRRLDSLADQVSLAKKEATAASQSLQEQRDAAAKLAADREAAALELDALAREREMSTREAAQVIADQDTFIAELVESHERELESAARQLEFVQDGAKQRERDMADLREDLARSVDDRERLSGSVERMTQEHAHAMARVLHEADQREKRAAAKVAQLEATVARLEATVARLEATVVRLEGDASSTVDTDGDVLALKSTIARLVDERDKLTDEAERDIADLKGTISRLIATIPPPPMEAAETGGEIADLKSTIRRLLEERDAITEEAERDIADLKGTIARLLQSSD